MPNKTIILVDDAPMQLTRINDIVAGAGYTTVTATTGREAIDKARQIHPDLILLDVVMPEMDGFVTCRELRDDPATKNIPVVFVSSKDKEADKVWGQMQGGKGYITKPYTDENILQQIKSIL